MSTPATHTIAFPLAAWSDRQRRPQPARREMLVRTPPAYAAGIGETARRGRRSEHAAVRRGGGRLFSSYSAGPCGSGSLPRPTARRPRSYGRGLLDTQPAGGNGPPLTERNRNYARECHEEIPHQRHREDAQIYEIEAGDADEGGRELYDGTLIAPTRLDNESCPSRRSA